LSFIRASRRALPKEKLVCTLSLSELVASMSIVVCVLLTPEDGIVQRQIRTFSTMTADVLTCVDWLESKQIEIVAMGSTGVFWRPIFNLLEAHFKVMLVNAQHRKAVPGRKTDVKESEWIAELLRHGLLKASFIPPQPLRDLRDLTRYRKTLMQERAQEVNRLQKVLETANLKLASVASDVFGKSGREMLDALVGGERDPEVLAELARRRVRTKLSQLRLALDDRVRPHQTFLLQQILAHIDFLKQSLESLQAEIEERLVPFEKATTLLDSLPVVMHVAKAVVVAEIGDDRSRFPSAKHLASWAGAVSRQQGKRGQTLEWVEHQRQCLPALGALSIGLVSRSFQNAELFLLALSPHRSTTRQKTGDHRCCSPFAGQHLPYDPRQQTLPGSGAGLPGEARLRAIGTPGCPTSATTWL